MTCVRLKRLDGHGPEGEDMVMADGHLEDSILAIGGSIGVEEETCGNAST